MMENYGDAEFDDDIPQLGSSYGIRSWLKTHVGLDPKKIERMFKLRSRWVVVDQHAPNWVLSEHLLYIL